MTTIPMYVWSSVETPIQVTGAKKKKLYIEELLEKIHRLARKRDDLKHQIEKDTTVWGKAVLVDEHARVVTRIRTVQEDLRLARKML